MTNQAGRGPGFRPSSRMMRRDVPAAAAGVWVLPLSVQSSSSGPSLRFVRDRARSLPRPNPESPIASERCPHFESD